MLRFQLTLSLSLLASFAGCSSPSLDGTNFSCESDADCTDGKVCGARGGTNICLMPNTTDIVIGMSAPLQGASADLGVEMRRGVNALFSRVNAEGGVFGRQIFLNCLNDNYDPALALANTRQLLDIQQQVPDLEQPDVRGPSAVLALLGSVGTPPMLETAPIATKNRTVFFAPFTGAQKYLRDGTNSPYVYNLRAGYYQETDAIVDYLSTMRTPRVINGADSYKRIIAFTQRDSYGDAGYLGLVNSYNTRIGPLPQPDPMAPNPSIRRVQYDRDNLESVSPAITQTQQMLREVLAEAVDTPSVAIVMVDTYQPGNRFVREMKDWLNGDRSRALGIDVVFIHLSFVGSDALANLLTSAPATYTHIITQEKKSYAAGVMVTQVVPYYKDNLPGLTQFRNDMANLDADVGQPTFTSLEGYLGAKLFVEALKRNGAALDGESLVHTLDTKIVDVDLGIGVPLNFSVQNHQASDSVWGSEMQTDGSFSIPFVWDPANKIVAAAVP